MKKVTCIVCPNGCSITVDKDESNKWVVSGNMCERGREFAVREMTNPTRSVCSTVKTKFKNCPRLPVKTNGEVPLVYVFNVMNEINKVIVSHSVKIGDVIISNVFNTGVDVISTSDMCET